MNRHQDHRNHGAGGLRTVSPTTSAGAKERKRAKELKAERPPRCQGRGRREGRLAKIAKVPAAGTPDRVIGERLHAMIQGHRAGPWSRTHGNGMPAYAKGRQGSFCHFQSAQKFKDALTGDRSPFSDGREPR